MIDQEPETPETEEYTEVSVMDITDKDEDCDPIPRSFVDRPLNTAPWQEGERPETTPIEEVSEKTSE